ncbi:MAG: 16S rRNA (uracil(1498)-N(3))-methyltransferase [Erysipelotrichales bacterium]|nr:MAG: 16S rRNA (uracil(1498)-N(3))-methyltransferase [Erysipelotrichales bacterium]
MQQYFVAQTLREGDIIVLDKDIFHHQRTVLRAASGNHFRIADANGRLFLATLELNADIASASILETIEEDNEMPVQVTIIQALIKGDRWDYFLQKATECGVTRIVPYLSERNVVKFDAKSDGKKPDRWRKIVREAAEQSHRNRVPEIVSPITFKDLNNYLSDVNFVAYELEANSERQLKDIRPVQGSVSVLIGSEGGFSPREIEQFTSIGFHPVGLGQRILRAETAAMVALTLIETRSEPK